MQYITPQDLKSFGLIPELVGRLPVQVLSSVSARTVTVFIEASVMNPEKVLGLLSAQAVRPAKASAAIRDLMLFMVSDLSDLHVAANIRNSRLMCAVCT